MKNLLWKLRAVIALLLLVVTVAVQAQENSSKKYGVYLSGPYGDTAIGYISVNGAYKWCV